MQARRPPFRVSVLLILSVAGRLAGQDLKSSQGQDASIKVRTNFVQVAVVVQRSGKHVPTLTKRNFVVQQDGKNQPIATFEEVHAAAAVPRAGPNEEFANTGDVATNPRQITIIAIDTVNTSVIDQAYFKQEFLKFLGEADEGLFGLVELTRSGVRILHDFTTDPKKLLAAVQKSGPVQPTKNNDKSTLIKEETDEADQRLELQDQVYDGQAQKRFDNAALLQEAEDRMVQFQDRTARFDTLASLQQLAQALKGLPGRKTLLWAGSGFELLGGMSRVKGIISLSNGPAKFGDEALDEYAYTWKLLSDANVAVYPIDTRRTVNTAYEVMNPSQKYTPLASQRELARQADRETLDTFLQIAAETGGKPCIFRTDLHECMREAIKDNAAYYLLGFYVDKARSAPGWHKIKVTLDEKATLRYRSGFLIASNASEAFRNIDLHLALNSPFDYTALPFHGRFTGLEEDGAKKSANFELNMPPSSVTIEEDSGKVNFDVWAVVRALGGAEVARLGQRIDRKLTSKDIANIKAKGIYYKNKITLAPGEYGVWFVVRDNLADRIGSAVIWLKVP